MLNSLFKSINSLIGWLDFFESPYVFFIEMKTLSLTLLMLFHLSFVFSQPKYDSKRDFVWIMGKGWFPNDTVRNTLLNFNFDTLQLAFKRQKGQNFFQTNASICDSSGKLLFYSNGCVLSDTNSYYITGSDTINKGPGWVTCSFSGQPATIRTDGYNIVNGCWILPTSENRFKVFYADLLWSATYGYSSGIRFATVKREAVTGWLTGEHPDTYLFHGVLAPELRGVVRHANGRDWWMINEAVEDKMYYVSRIDDSPVIHPTDSFYFPQLPVRKFHGGSQGCFSPDGTKYCTISSYNQCQVFDFDRCSGVLANPVHIPLPVPYDSIYGATGIAVSPNSRYLYLMTNLSVWQYDLSAFDIEGSKIKVAQNDGWTDPFGDILTFYQSQLGPDGKIYIFPTSGRQAFSVIDNPDEAGLACSVLQHRYYFLNWSNVSQPPRFPNFRLGPVVGSPCDTIISAINEPEVMQARMLLRPNPATSYTVADLSVTDYSAEMQLTLTVSDLSGSVLGTYAVPPYAALQRIETGGLPNGMYFVALKSRGRVVRTEKLVVLRD
jgi:hypothetical protein